MLRMLPGLVLLACLPGRAFSAIPSAAQSTIPSHVVLVGLSGNLADTTSGAFTVVLRDVADNPMPFEIVEFRALLCPGARIAVEQLQEGVTSRCATNAVRATTDLNGMVRIAVVGGGLASAPHGTGPCAQVFGGPGVALGTVRLGYLDLDGMDGLGANDLSIWLTDFATGESIARADYDGDDQLGAGDLSLWLTAWSAGRATQSPSSYCPIFRTVP